MVGPAPPPDRHPRRLDALPSAHPVVQETAGALREFLERLAREHGAIGQAAFDSAVEIIQWRGRGGRFRDERGA